MANESFRCLRDSLRREPVVWVLLGTSLLIPGAVLLWTPHGVVEPDKLRSAAGLAIFSSSLWTIVFVSHFVFGVEAAAFAGSEERCREVHRALRTLWAAAAVALSAVALSQAFLPAEIAARGWGLLTGGFLILTGNRFPQLRVPSPFGVNLRWGRSNLLPMNEPTWRRVQRFGGRCYVLSGIATIVGSLLLPVKVLGNYGLLWLVAFPLVPVTYAVILVKRGTEAP